MDAEIKNTLKRQLELLAERSKNASDAELSELTAQMINLAKLIDPQTQSLFREALMARLPPVSLSVRDVWDIVTARVERAHRQDDAQKSQKAEAYE